MLQNVQFPDGSTVSEYSMHTTTHESRSELKEDLLEFEFVDGSSSVPEIKFYVCKKVSIRFQSGEKLEVDGILEEILANRNLILIPRYSADNTYSPSVCTMTTGWRREID